MPWRDAHELQIFAPSQEPFGDNWVEQILGSVVTPLKAQFENSVRWVWLTRYANEYNPSAPPLGYAIPEEYLLRDRFRYVLFRASVAEERESDFRNRAIALAQDAQCFTNPQGWIPYDVVSDLGNNRFISASATDDERTERARLVINFINSILELMLHSLVHREDGRWMIETNADAIQNPDGTFFQSIHHLMCNATAVPTYTLLTRRQHNLLVTTPIAFSWNHILSIPLPEEDRWYKVPLQF